MPKNIAREHVTVKPTFAIFIETRAGRCVVDVAGDAYEARRKCALAERRHPRSEITVERIAGVDDLTRLAFKVVRAYAARRRMTVGRDEAGRAVTRPMTFDEGLGALLDRAQAQLDRERATA